MKNTLKFFGMLMAGVLLLAACNKSDIPGYKKTKSGLHYKFETTNGGEKLHLGEVVVGEMVLRLDADTLFTNMGNPGRLFQISDSVYHDINISEGLLMMGKGDKASFAIFADSVSKFFDGQMPQSYVNGKGQIFYYDIMVDDVVSVEELHQEQENFYERMTQRKEQEPADIANYVKSHGITAAPTSNGLYVVVRKKGKGNTVAAGRTVSIRYTGRLFDGTVFDSNVENDARAAGINRPSYEALTYEVGKMPLIKGWEQGIEGMPAGSELTLVIPSALAYGSRGQGQQIEPYTPLVFDISIVSVK
ncbi:MAG: FKBP-type peptidyl-prolyl cis-trans isomerase [Bacteroidales bacterium]|nr:FKBP-type peptidyl-prolyl cis-trans isomerase [Bacteroidales bacterium]